jgi:hypothetical protein
MLVAKVVFFLTIVLPGYPPFRHSEPVDDIVACLTAEMEFLTRAAQRALADGREFSAGCNVEVARAIEH